MRSTGHAAAEVAVVGRRGLKARTVRVADLPGLHRAVGQTPRSGRAVRPGATVSLYASR